MPANKTRRPAPDSVPRDTAPSRRARAALGRQARRGGQDDNGRSVLRRVDHLALHVLRLAGEETAPECTKLPNGELRILRADYEQWLKDLRGAA